jgi:hypothetical protein
VRKGLADAKTRIEKLEAAQHALAGRQRDLESALADAGSATASSDPALRARRDELVGGLTSARDDVIAKREKLGGALENVRLQLLRVKSGIGSVPDVANELRAAETLAS